MKDRGMTQTKANHDHESTNVTWTTTRNNTTHTYLHTLTRLH